jgi:hypothetical protein
MKVVDQQVDNFTQTGKYGHVPKTKPADTIQIIFENSNSLGVFIKGRACQKDQTAESPDEGIQR